MTLLHSGASSHSEIPLQRGLGHGGGRCGGDWGVRGRWVEEIRMVEKEEIIWQWSLTTGEGALYAHQLAGLQFNQVMSPIMVNCSKSCEFNHVF